MNYVIRRMAATAAALAVCHLAVGASPPGPALHPELGSYSFRGLQVPVGATSSSIAIVLNNVGRTPLKNITASTFGDFTLTANHCAAATPPAAHCAVAVAFKPSASGLRVGGLELSADGVAPQTVTLDGGGPVGFASTAPGVSAVQWVELSETGALSASVTGPFAIAIQPSYAYGAINGVKFAASASTKGLCAVSSGSPCSLFLGVQLLASAPLGTATGTVTLSDGAIYTVHADVLGPALDVEPASLALGSVPVASHSDTTTIKLTNVSAATITVGAVSSLSGPFTVRSACPASLAPQASCVLNVVFSPTATGNASGFAQLSTSQGNVGIALSGIGLDNPANISVNPATLNLPLLASNDSGSRRITLTNLSSTDAVTIGTLNGNFCYEGDLGPCLDLTTNTCSTLAPAANCQLIVHYVGTAGSSTQVSAFDVPVTSGSTTVDYSISYTDLVPNATAPSLITLSSTDLHFPATPFGSASAAQTLTVTNVSETSLSVIPSSIEDFIGDPVCAPLLPGASCQIRVHFVPTSGNTVASSVLNFLAYAYSSVDDGTPPLGGAGVTVSGTSISTAALASPSYPPLVSPLPIDEGFVITNASTTPLVLARIYGGGNSQWDATNCPRTLAAGASCSIQPTTGCEDATIPCSLTIDSNAASSPDVYSVLGQSGDGSDALNVTPGPLVFAPTSVGGTSSTQTIYVVLGEELVPSNEPFEVYPSLPSDFTIDNQCPSTLMPSPGAGFYQAECRIFLKFTPQSPGFKVGTLTWTSPFDSGTVLVAGTGIGASQLTVSPASLFLGAQAGQTATQTVTLTNTASAATPLGSFALAGTSAASFSIGATTCGASLAAGASCTVAVIYSTPSTYLATASLVITAGSGTVLTVGLSGVIPAVFLYSGSTPSAVSVGLSVRATATFQSYDGYPITLSSVALKGANAASYSILSSTCTPNLVLQGTTGCTVELQFAPQAVGNLAETLEFHSSIGTNDIDVTSEGVAQAATIAPGTLDFGTQALGTPSAPLSVTLTNPNPVAIAVNGAGSLSGANRGDFSFTGSCTSIAAEGSCTYAVTFTPSAAGVRSASLPVNLGTIDRGNGSIIPANSTVALIGGGVANEAPSVSLAAAYNVDGIGVDGKPLRAGGLDGLGDAYSAKSLGKNLYWSGAYFSFGAAGTGDAISGGTVALPAGNFVALKLLATAVRSNQVNQVFVINYTDGTSTAFEQSLSSWTTPQHYAGESVAATMAYRLNPDGSSHAGIYNLYGYSFALDNTKTVKSLTLPNDREVVVLAMDLAVTRQVPVDLSPTANVSAVHEDGVAADGAGIDDLGSAYSAQLLGTSLTWGGIPFNLPQALPLDALADTSLTLPAGSFSKLNVLATGVRGNQPAKSFTITYTDGTTASFKQNFSDWHTPQGYAGESNVFSMPYRLNGDGSKHAGTYWVYGYSIPIDPTKTLKSVALPGVRTVVVLAVTLSP